MTSHRSPISLRPLTEGNEKSISTIMLDQLYQTYQKEKKKTTKLALKPICGSEFTVYARSHYTCEHHLASMSQHFRTRPESLALTLKCCVVMWTCSPLRNSFHAWFTRSVFGRTRQMLTFMFEEQTVCQPVGQVSAACCIAAPWRQTSAISGGSFATVLLSAPTSLAQRSGDLSSQTHQHRWRI